MNLKYSSAWLLKQTQGNRLAICGMVLSGVLRVMCGLGFVYMTKEMIDQATDGTQGSFMRYVVYMGLLMTGGVFLNAVMGCARSMTEVKVENRLREHLLGHLLEWREHTDTGAFRHTGDVQSRMISDVRTVAVFLTVSLPQLFVSGVQLVASFWYLRILDIRLAYIAMLSLFICLIFGRVYAKQMHRLTHEVRHKEGRIVSLIQERIQHRTMIQSLNQEPEQVNQLREEQADLLNRETERTRFSIYSKTMFALGFGGMYLFTLIFGAVQLHDGFISFGVMMAFIQLTGQVQRPITEVMRVLPSVATMLASTERLCELEVSERNDSPDPIILDGCAGLRVSDLSFSYDKGLVLSDVSYDFRPGSVTAIMGESGSGKTTLIRLALALIAPKHGELTLYNESKTITVSSRTRINFVYVPQGNTLLSGTIRENLKLGNPHASEEDIKQALYTATAEFVHELPEGLDSRCGEKGCGLSEGQAQRIAVARSLLRPGSILLLDEITSALDEETEQLLIRRLEENAVNKTIILVTHREYISSGRDKLVLNSAGRSADRARIQPQPIA